MIFSKLKKLNQPQNRLKNPVANCKNIMKKSNTKKTTQQVLACIGMKNQKPLKTKKPRKTKKPILKKLYS